MDPAPYLHGDRARGAHRIAAAFALVAMLSLAACQRTVNMATAQNASWNATTIPYSGVREENRQYPDYSIISASVLAPAAGAQKAPSGKRGAPR